MEAVKEKTIIDDIENLLDEIKMKKVLKGYLYLKRVIEKYYIEPDKYRRKIYSVIYNEVATEFNTTYSCVEKNIRKAIESVWQYGNTELLYQIYGPMVSIDTGKVTSAKFVMRTVDVLRGIK